MTRAMLFVPDYLFGLRGPHRDVDYLRVVPFSAQPTVSVPVAIFLTVDFVPIT